MLFITHDLSVLVEVSRPARDHVRGQDHRGGPGRDGLPFAPAPVHEALAAAFPEIGDDRFRGSPAGSAATRPTLQTSRPAARSIRGARGVRGLRRRSSPSCTRPGEGRRAACLLVPAAPATSTGRRTVSEAEVTAPDADRARTARPSSRSRTSRSPSRAGRALRRALAARRARRRGRSTASIVRAATGRGAGARGRVRLRQDHHRPRDHGLCSPRRGRDPATKASRSAERPEAVPAEGADGLPGPDGPLNPRQTIYEIVAEGLRIHGIHRAPTARPRRSSSRGRSRARACARPSASTCCTRTSSPAASASAW